jgi:hypothetical protein
MERDTIRTIRLPETVNRDEMQHGIKRPFEITNKVKKLDSRNKPKPTPIGAAQHE